ncbi:MAG: hypothetical protein J7L45_02215 [Candidatus Aenigmarchaeota archaeon]|nr:hypothetical protein [Candidatus Aenigmarchaeota archaeon]
MKRIPLVEENENLNNLLFRDMQDLVKIRKPIVKRKGDTVYYCSFFKRTGQCFGSRCFWVHHGKCPFFKG